MTDTKNTFSWRKLFNDVHLWMGIASGLILFLVCLSGTLYTFRTEVEEMLEPSKYNVSIPEGAGRLPVEEIIAAVGQEIGGTVSYVEIPEDESRSYTLNIKKSPEERRGTRYLVDPYTAQVLGSSEGPATGFFMTMFRLHRWLLMDSAVGGVIVGSATIVFVILLLTGIVLWWPKKLKHWKQGLKVKTSGNWKRLNHDLHNSLGFYSFLLLLVMSLTGLCWSFNWYRTGLSTVLGAEVFGGRREKPVLSDTTATGGAPPAVADFIALAGEEFPYSGDIRIVLPASPEGAVVIDKYETGFFAPSVSDEVQFDQYSGQVLKVERFSEKPLNAQIASSIKPLHTGEIFGTFSKILYFFACLIATSLPVTGTIIWINKLRKKAKKKPVKTVAAKTASVV